MRNLWARFKLWRSHRRAWRHYQRTGEAGESHPMTVLWYQARPEVRAMLITSMTILAEDFGLPPGTIFEVRLSHPTDYGRSQGIAWYTNREMQRPGYWVERDDTGYAPSLGVWIVERRAIPTKEPTYGDD